VHTVVIPLFIPLLIVSVLPLFTPLLIDPPLQPTGSIVTWVGGGGCYLIPPTLHPRLHLLIPGLTSNLKQPTGSIVMHKKERSRLHHMALSYADLLAKLVDNNEKVRTISVF